MFLQTIVKYFSIFMARKLGQTLPLFILFIISKASDKKPFWT